MRILLALLVVGGCGEPATAPKRVDPASLVNEPPAGVRVETHGQPNRPDLSTLVSTTWCEGLSTGAAMSERLGVPGLAVRTKADEAGLGCLWSVPCPPEPEVAADAGSSAEGAEAVQCFEKQAMQLTLDCAPELHVRKTAPEWAQMHVGMGGELIPMGDQGSTASYLHVPDRVSRLELADNGCTLSFYVGAIVVPLEPEPMREAIVSFATEVERQFPAPPA